MGHKSKIRAYNFDQALFLGQNKRQKLFACTLAVCCCPELLHLFQNRIEKARTSGSLRETVGMTRTLNLNTERKRDEAMGATPQGKGSGAATSVDDTDATPARLVKFVLPDHSQRYLSPAVFAAGLSLLLAARPPLVGL